MTTGATTGTTTGTTTGRATSAGPGWVAVSVRAAAMARRRLGVPGAERVAAAPGLPAALDRLSGTAYAERASPADTAARAQRAVADTLLWQMRVLAGWSPPGGTAWARSLIAGFERENIVEHLRALRSSGRDPQSPAGVRGAGDQGPAADTVPAGDQGPAGDVPPPYDLGALGTAWSRLAATTTPAALLAELDASPWGHPRESEPALVRDVLSACWLRRLGGTVPAAGPWARAGAVLLTARATTTGSARLPAAAVPALTHLVGPDAPGCTTIADLRRAVPRATATVLDGVTGPADLWQAESRLAELVESGGFALLRRSLPGPDLVVGAVAVLAVDAWRVRAALAAAQARPEPS